MEKSGGAVKVSSSKSYKLHSLNHGTGEILIQTPIPSSIIAAVSFVSEHGKQQTPDLFSDWTHGDKTPQKCPKGDDSSSIIDSMACSHLSNINMCAIHDNKRHNHVYKRRKLHKNSVELLSAEAATTSTKESGYLSSISSEWHSLDTKKDNLRDSKIKCDTNGTKTLVIPAVLSTQDNDTKGSKVVLKTESFDLCPDREEDQGFAQGYNPVVRKSTLDLCRSANESCSSSKSSLEHGLTSLKSEVDEIGECSSSDIVSMELSTRNPLEKEMCVSMLRENGLLDGGLITRACTSPEAPGVSDDPNCSQSCKICGVLENASKMLICDDCEEAYHLSCCNPQVKKIPVDEWCCQPCAKKKHRPPVGATTEKSLNCKSEVPVCWKPTSRGEASIFSVMLKDVEPYTTRVRIGKAFQAAVPDWSGPVSGDSDIIGEPFEMDSMECVKGWSSNQSSTPRSIGNWLQCREVLYANPGDSDGVVCGKWHRAPLFEIQTDDWDCSCAVLWDPSHSDCAVPQELGTKEVLMHLKYIELLRSRLASKRRTPVSSKSNGSEESLRK